MERLENQLMGLMLQNIEFRIDNKVVKRGRVKVFNTKQFFIKFKLENAGEFKDYELPYPYRVVKTPSGFLFDYCLSAFCPPTEEVYWRMRTMNKSSSSKLHDNYLTIVALSA